MLHRTLLKSGHGAEVAHAAHGHGHAAHAKKLIPGSAGYYNRSDLGWVHGHHEMNYRKKALGMKAYSTKGEAHFDIWAPFANKLPYRHQETSAPGLWFAAGTPLDLWSWSKGVIPWLRWPLMGKSLLWMGTPFLVQAFAHNFRFTKGGSVQKNVGAVFGVAA